MTSDLNTVITRTAPLSYPLKRMAYLATDPATLFGFHIGFFAEDES